MSFGDKTFSSVIYRLVEAFLVFLINLVIARLCAAAYSGQLFYWMSILSFILLLVSININTGLAYFYSSNQAGSREIFRISVYSIGLLSLATFIVLFIWNHFKNNEFGIAYSLLFITGSFMVALFQSLFYKNQNFRTPFMVQLGSAIVTLLAAFLCLHTIADHYSFFQIFSRVYLLSFFLTGSCMTIAFFFLYVRKEKKSRHGQGVLQKIVRYSLLALSSNLISFLIYRLDYWFVEKYCTADDLGNYIQVNKLNTFLFLLPRILAVNIFLVAAVSDDHKTVTTYLEKISRALQLICFPVMLVIIFFGDSIFSYFFGSSYHTMHLIFNYMFWGVALYMIMVPFAAFFAAKNMIRVNILSGIIALAVLISGNLIFTVQYGVVAAALSCALAYSVQAVIVIGYYKYHRGLHIGNMVGVKRQDIERISSLLRNMKL